MIKTTEETKMRWDTAEGCQGLCPYCGSRKCSGDGSSKLVSGVLIIPIKCEVCHRYFEEAYGVGEYLYTKYKVKEENK